MPDTDDALWPEHPVEAGVTPVPQAVTDDERAAAEAEEALRAELDETKNRLRRSLAELDNTRKRNARQAADLRAAARAEAAAAWLPVIDNLERAATSAGRDGGRSGLADGVRSVHEQAVSLLADLGFRRHAETRIPFDPYLHEAVGVSYDADAEPGTVVEVVKPGYGEGGRQLRPTSVVVAGTRE